MKENKLIEMKNKVEALTRVVQQLITELQFTREVAVGSLETIKKCQDMKKRWKSLKRKLLRSLVKQRPLKPWERLSNRIGYMGAGFVIAGQWTIEPIFL